MVCVKVPPRCGRHFAAPALCRAPRFSYHYPALGRRPSDQQGPDQRERERSG